MQKFLTIVFLAVAALAVLFAFVWKPSYTNVIPPKPEGHLAAAIPMGAGKWRGVDKPLAETEEVLRATVSILNVTEFLNRTYTSSDGKSFTLYISYWASGREPIRTASTHVPDRCWVSGGWKNLAEFKQYGRELELSGEQLMPMYSRKFEIADPASGRVYSRNVWYWYVSDGEPYDFAMENLEVPNPYVYFKQIFTEAMVGIPEQYFIRLDSDLPMEKLFEDPDFKTILKSLGNLVLYKCKGETNERAE